MLSRELALSKRDALAPVGSPDGPAAAFEYLLSRLAEGQTGSVNAEEPDAAGAVPIYLCADRDGLFVKQRPAVRLTTYSTANLGRLIDYMLRSVLAVEGSHAFGWLTVRFIDERGRRYFTLCIRRHTRFGECFQIDQSTHAEGT
jgi:hypothetical protein